MIVLKIGGSLFERAPEILERVKSLGGDILIVPGGSSFADTVREIYHKRSISDDTAHWMAILAMEEYAYYLSGRTGISLSASLSKGRGVRIVLPYDIIRRHDVLPHSWDVTSDTIAAWMASRLKSKLVKVTDVDGIFYNGRLLESVNASQLAHMGETCVDRAMPGYLVKNRMDAFVVNGLYPERVVQVLTGKPAIGTRILGR